MENPLNDINDIIDDIFDLTDIDFKQKNLQSFHITLFNIIVKIINSVETNVHNKEGRIKKYIVIQVGLKLIQKYYPEQEEFYVEYIDNLIELVIDSYYMLKKSKGTKTICFPCF
jgi:hypothetical protein